MSDELSRRNFVKSSAGIALATGPAILPALGANNKVTVGWVGIGSRGNYVMDMMYKASADAVQVVAVCDTFQGNLAKGKDRVQTMGGNTPKTYVDYKELLADPSIDVVFITT